MKTIKIYLIGSQLAKSWLNIKTLDSERFVIAGQSERADKALDDIFRTQPFIITHITDKHDEEDMLLLQKVKANTPEIYYVVVSNFINYSQRHQYLTKGANIVLNLMYEMKSHNEILINATSTFDD